MVSSVLSPEKVVGRQNTNRAAAQNFVSGGSLLGSSVLNSAANKIVGFQRAGVQPAPSATGSIVSTISTNINNNVTSVINKTLQGFSTDYQKRLKQVDDAKPIGILGKFLTVYKTSLGFIQFFGNKKNIDKVRDNLEALKKSFTESFEVAKLIRQVIIKIVKQLSNLPVASPSGGGGLNLDVDIPGGGLKKSAPRGLGRMMRRVGGKGRMLALGAGALGLGAAGGAAVNALSDSPTQVQAAGTSPEIPGDIGDKFSSIVDRFANAISKLFETNKQKSKQQQSSGSSSGGGEKKEKEDKTKPSGETGAPGVTATGTEQQKTEALIAGEEGVVLKAYQNPGDVPTIGYGQTRINGRAVQMGDVMTKEQATSGLRSNIESHRQVAIRNIGKDAWNNIKDENSKAVLTSLAYNYGHVPPSVVSSAKSGDPKKISDAVRGLTDPSNKSYDSRLIGRRNREADFIITGKSPKLDKDFLAGGKLSTGSASAPQATPQAAQKPGAQVAATPQAQAAQKPGVQVAATPQAQAAQKPGVQVAATPQAQAAQVEAAKTAQTQVAQRAAAVSQTAQTKPQVNYLPIDMSGGGQQQTGGGGGTSGPPPAQGNGPSVPFLPASNTDNFLVLYSRMVYNIVDG